MARSDLDIDLALKNLTTLVTYAAGKRALRNESINRLSMICEEVRTLRRMAPAAVTVDLVAHLAKAAHTLGVDLSGKP